MLGYSEILTILDTNIAETGDFLKTFFDVKILLVLILLAVPFILIYFHRPIYIKSRNIKIGLTIVAILLLVFLLPKSWVQRKISILNLYQTYNIVKRDRSIFIDEMTKKLTIPNIFDNITTDLNSNNHTFVIVLGESVNRNHMSIYGYKRGTTPNFLELKDELYIFNDVITSEMSTSGSLEKILTFSTIEEPELLLKYGDILDYFKSAKFKTYWLSNQYFLGPADSKYAAIAYLADNKTFLSSGSKLAMQDIRFDSLLLPYFREMLADSAKNKVIFAHLMGSHIPAGNRFPESFDKFPTPTFAEYKSRTINNYDNSIYFTDYVLNEIINMLENDNSTSYMLYFADHGEDIFDTSDEVRVARRTINPTPPMYEVPFVLWLSPKYKKAYAEYVRGFDNITSRPYQTDKVIHSILDLSRLNSKVVKKNYSIFSKDYKRFVRTIYGKEIN